MKKSMKLTEILITVMIAVAFGLVYILWGTLYYALKPLGLQMDQFIYGMWFIAAPVAFLIIRKPGVALLAEIAAASGEFLLGSAWGLTILLYGVVQGLFFEFVLMAFKYKKFNIGVMILGGLAAAAGSVIMDYYYGEIGSLSAWNLTLFMIARFLGGALFAGVLPYYLVKALEATGVTNLVRPATDKDYDTLNQ
ncbi:ECF transporter S component [Mesobacillus zeae]|uniref:Thiamine ABC transporter permease n=1 Tax=Mesobacillus zeae TaxID=1917180 RepID=A0A398BGF3_9BACI|nr:ECF transporter S component [Mesobacillus zeae]RID88281.1 thiamine ABC transporter permease [Mesobacillus zeae]